MKITLDVRGTSGSAIAAALTARKEQLETELAEINANLEQLRKAGALNELEKEEIKHGQTEKAILAFIIKLSPYSVGIDQIVEGVGASTATVYRALKKLKSEGVVVQLIDKNWLLSNGGMNLPQ